ncbi:alpha/beta fold hydrolase [Azospirillum sp. RWY-5-1]|uniref:Alpha/beta fold hydrolase n=1 Tax=Azospirillum oleiclasticum TaxID=2735135 RepID=A0ABX2T632_9PROT|nr:alpha/beta fold hydrolase [Azospirillum oleiclasticum]NYZ12591.1 alpha/beta fold hydrolase [Azospirillum oleiclasticum]NYZ19751.1 alpha/beta fold hydrolase [Azospirillum oleiclasticum]
MTPIVFDGCFGWLHPTSGGTSGGRGVVLCAPHSHEEWSVHRAWRGFARDLAAAGLPTLRFDWHGTGDSAGGEEEPERVAVWLANIRAAVERLRAETGVTEVALVGLRLGATLAAVAAAGMGGVDRLVLLAPPVSGRAYVQEVKALIRLSLAEDRASNGAEMPRPPERADGIEGFGFLFTGATLADLARIDLAALPARPAPRVLLLNPGGLRGVDRLASRLTELGAELAEEGFPDFARLMRSAETGHAPAAPFAAAVSWLAADAPPAAPAAILSALTEPVLPLPQAVERPVRFGAMGRLFGVLCTPAAPTDRPALLFLNSGITHHVGSGRAAVEFARRLAVQGFPSLRIDVAGIGDSESPPDGVDNRLYRRDSLPDVLAAVDWLAAQGFGRVVAVGLCAGAALALNAALADERIVGQVVVNPGRFVLGEGITAEMAVRSAARAADRYAGMLTRPEAWRALLRGDPRVLQVARTLGGRAAGGVRRWWTRLATRGDGADVAATGVLEAFRRLDARGVRTLLVYAADDVTLGERDAHLGRGARRLAGLARTRLECVPGADHSFLLSPARERLARLIEGHLAAKG